ncbi:MAG TPA: hypothetical protein VN380_19400 [Thermoanaerobaculia bacterium]|jgi:hypothetical protein|nr:hypothetical protein [Thermoanaerobaculia bacterium]
MQNLGNVRPAVMMAVILLIAVGASAAAPGGAVGPVGKTTGVKTIIALDGPAAPTGPVDNSQCHHWKLGDDNQSGTTWVSASNAYLYTGAGIQFTPNKFTAPEDFSSPSPDLAGVIGVGIANPNFIPRTIDVFYSLLPVSRSSSSTLQPPPATVGLTWFNSYEAGNRFQPSENTVTTYPVFGQLNYSSFFPPLNPNTRYLVFLHTGDNGNGAAGKDRGFAAAGVICFNR